MDKAGNNLPEEVLAYCYRPEEDGGKDGTYLFIRKAESAATWIDKNQAIHGLAARQGKEASETLSKPHE